MIHWLLRQTGQRVRWHNSCLILQRINKVLRRNNTMLVADSKSQDTSTEYGVGTVTLKVQVVQNVRRRFHPTSPFPLPHHYFTFLPLIAHPSRSVEGDSSFPLRFAFSRF
jgi:hypothetical protein